MLPLNLKNQRPVREPLILHNNHQKWGMNCYYEIGPRGNGPMSQRRSPSRSKKDPDILKLELSLKNSPLPQQGESWYEVTVIKHGLAYFHYTYDRKIFHLNSWRYSISSRWPDYQKYIMLILISYNIKGEES